MHAAEHWSFLSFLKPFLFYVNEVLGGLRSGRVVAPRSWGHNFNLDMVKRILSG